MALGSLGISRNVAIHGQRYPKTTRWEVQLVPLCMFRHASTQVRVETQARFCCKIYTHEVMILPNDPQHAHRDCSCNDVSCRQGRRNQETGTTRKLGVSLDAGGQLKRRAGEREQGG